VSPFEEDPLAHDAELIQRFVRATGERMPAVVESFRTLFERSWPVPAALDSLWTAERTSDARSVCERLVAAFDAVQARHGTVMFWWKDEDSRFLGFCPRLAQASGLDAHTLVGCSDADPRVAWNRQAALYMRDDREVLASAMPRFDIVERQDREEGTVWLRTSKVPYMSAVGAGTLGGLDVISVAEATRLAKLAR